MVSQSSDLGEIDGIADRFLCLTRQAKDEVGVDGETKVVAVLGECTRALDGGALLDILQDLRIARFITDDQQAASGIFHRLQRLAVRGDA